MNDATVIHAHSAEQTLDLGRRIGAVLRGGWVIGLVGELGVGKTHLVKGIADGNRVPGRTQAEVTSPTFVLINEYPGRVTLYHVDAYRLHAARELDDLGLEEMIADGAVLVEWADRVAGALPADRLTITGRATGATDRTWTLRAQGPASHGWLSRIS